MVLLIDDEPHVIYNLMLMRALEEHGCPLRQCTTVDGAWDAIQELARAGELDSSSILIDVMMPSGRLFSLEESKLGMTTGLLLYRKLRNLSERCRVVLLTNLTDASLDLASTADSHCTVVTKTDMLPGDVARMICAEGRTNA